MRHDRISGHRDPKMALKLFVTPKPFGSRLGDLIASNNAAREEEMTLLRRPVDTELSPPSSPRHQVSMINGRNSTVRSGGLDHVPVKITAPPKNTHHDANIESLIEKMKSGLEVCLISVPSCTLK